MVIVKKIKVISFLDIARDRPTGSFHFNTVQDFVEAYKSGAVTPSEIAEKTISSIAESKQLNAVAKYDVEKIRKVSFFRVLYKYIILSMLCVYAVCTVCVNSHDKSHFIYNEMRN